MKRIVAVATLLALGAVAHAQDYPLKGTTLRLIPQLGAAPATCLSPSGRVCIWYDGNTNTFKTHNSDGSDSLIGGTVLTNSPLAGDGSAGSHLTCTTCVVTSGSYANPAWITSLAGSKLGLMTGAAAMADGAQGAAPAPAAGQQGYFLRGDATWAPTSAATVTWHVGDSWATVYAAISALVAANGSALVVLVGASSDVSPFVIDNSTATLAFAAVEFVGPPEGAFVQIASGVNINGSAGPYLRSRSVVWRCLGTIYNAGNPVGLSIVDGGLVAVSSGVPAFILTGANTSTFLFRNSTMTYAAGSGPVINASHLSTVSLTFTGGGAITQTSVVANPGGGGNAPLFLTYDATTQPVTGWNGANTSATLTGAAKSPAVAYSPTTPGNWPVSPSQTSDALDKLASRIAATADTTGWYNVKTTCGAVGDGTTDDGPAFQTCFDKAQTGSSGTYKPGGTIYMPPGTYRIATGIAESFSTDAATVIFKGGGSSSVIYLDLDNAHDAFSITGNNNSGHIIFEDFTVLGHAAANYVPCRTMFKLDAVQAGQQFTVRRIQIFGVQAYHDLIYIGCASGGTACGTGAGIGHVEDVYSWGNSSSMHISYPAGSETALVHFDQILNAVVDRWKCTDFGQFNGVIYTSAEASTVGIFATSGTPQTPDGSSVGYFSALGNLVVRDAFMDEGCGIFHIHVGWRFTDPANGQLGTRFDVARIVGGFANAPSADGLYDIRAQHVNHLLVQDRNLSYSNHQQQFIELNDVGAAELDHVTTDTSNTAGSETDIMVDNSLYASAGTSGVVTVRDSRFRQFKGGGAKRMYVEQAGVRYRVRKADGAIASGSVVKAAPTAERVVVLGTGDSGALATGMCITQSGAGNPSTAGDWLWCAEQVGQEVPLVSDGTTSISPGDAVGPSSTTAGQVVKVTAGGTKAIGRAWTSGAASGTPTVNGRLEKETL